MTTTLYKQSNQPIKGSAYSFEFCLYSQSDTKLIKATPTLATGDVKISKDGGTLANIANLPAEISAGVLTVSLTDSEMSADRIAVYFHDTAGAEWCDAVVILSTVQAVSLNDITPAELLTSQLIESYAEVGTAPTLAQAIMAIQQFLLGRVVVGTEVSVLKLDNEAVALTLFLDDANAPTSIIRMEGGSS